MHGSPVAVEVLDEGDDAPLVGEVVALAAALVGDADADAGVQERELSQALGQHLEREVDGREDVAVGEEGDAGACGVGGADFLKVRVGITAAIGLAPDLSVASDLELEALRERVDHGHADAVQAAGDLVGGFVEFAARVESGHHDLGGWPAFLDVDVDGDPAPVVDDGDARVLVDHHRDLLAKAGHGLVDGVVHHLVDEVMQSPGTCGPDVHGRPLSDRIEALEDLDCAGVVAHVRAVPSCELPGGERNGHRGR